jgi:hypothetical protein
MGVVTLLGFLYLAWDLLTIGQAESAREESGAAAAAA